MINFLGLCIAKSSEIESIMTDLRDAELRLDKLERDLGNSLNDASAWKSKALSCAQEMETRFSEIEALEAEKGRLEADIKEKDAHILDMGKSLSEARDEYARSVEEKEALKKAFMDMERRQKQTTALLKQVTERYEELLAERGKEETENPETEIPEPETEIREDETEISDGKTEIPETGMETETEKTEISETGKETTETVDEPKPGVTETTGEDNTVEKELAEAADADITDEVNDTAVEEAPKVVETKQEGRKKKNKKRKK